LCRQIRFNIPHCVRDQTNGIPDLDQTPLLCHGRINGPGPRRKNVIGAFGSFHTTDQLVKHHLVTALHKPFNQLDVFIIKVKLFDPDGDNR